MGNLSKQVTDYDFYLGKKCFPMISAFTLKMNSRTPNVIQVIYDKKRKDREININGVYIIIIYK